MTSQRLHCNCRAKTSVHFYKLRCDTDILTEDPLMVGHSEVHEDLVFSQPIAVLKPDLNTHINLMVKSRVSLTQHCIQ